LKNRISKKENEFKFKPLQEVQKVVLQPKMKNKWMAIKIKQKRKASASNRNLSDFSKE
jgi:hypothetical protein